MTELLPCPFCGGKADLSVFYEDDTIDVPLPICDVEFVVVRCPSCGISKQSRYQSDATYWWNKRRPVPSLPVSEPGVREEVVERLIHVGLKEMRENEPDKPLDYGDMELIVRAILAALTSPSNGEVKPGWMKIWQAARDEYWSKRKDDCSEENALRAAVDTAVAMADGDLPSPPPKGEGWREIESAPKDCMKVLVWGGSHVYLAWFEGAYWQIGDNITLSAPVTHWMPLPPAPPTSEVTA